MGMFLANLDYLPIPVSEETLERRVARRAESVLAISLFGFFSPPRLFARLAPWGLGFSPFALEVIRTGYLRLPRHSRGGIVMRIDNLAQVRFALKSCDAWADY